MVENKVDIEADRQWQETKELIYRLAKKHGIKMKPFAQRGFAGLLGLIIVIAIIAGGGWLVAQRTDLGTSLSGDNSAIDAARDAVNAIEQRGNLEVEPPSEEVNTTNWKTYRNEEYGFEFKYPADWTAFSEAGDLVFAVVGERFADGTDAPTNSFRIVKMESPPPQSAQDTGWYHSDFGGAQLREISFSGRPLKVVLRLTDFNPKQKELDQILSSFRFTK